MSKGKRNHDGDMTTMPMWRQDAFVNEYLVSFDAAKAARAAGYAPTSSSRRGVAMLADPRVQQLLSERSLNNAAVTSVSIGEVIQALREIAFVDIGEAFAPVVTNGKWSGYRLKDILEMPKHVRRAIKGIRVIKRNLIAGDGETDDLYAIDWWNKNDALDALGRHVGLATVTVEHILTEKHVEKLPDTELAKKHDELREKWGKHVAARERLRLAAKNAPDADRGTEAGRLEVRQAVNARNH